MQAGGEARGIRVEAALPVPPDRAWPALVDFPSWPGWCLGVRRLECRPPEGGLGAERRLVLWTGARHRERITAWEPGRRFALALPEPPAGTRRFEAELRLEPAEAGARTRAVWSMRYELAAPRLLGALERALVAPLLRAILRASLRRLARRLGDGEARGALSPRGGAHRGPRARGR